MNTSRWKSLFNQRMNLRNINILWALPKIQIWALPFASTLRVGSSTAQYVRLASTPNFRSTSPFVAPNARDGPFGLGDYFR